MPNPTRHQNNGNQEDPLQRKSSRKYIVACLGFWRIMEIIFQPLFVGVTCGYVGREIEAKRMYEIRN